MKEMLIVSKFTIKDMIKRKSFIVSNIIFLLIILVGTNIPRILEAFNSDDENSRLLIVDNDNLLGESLSALSDNKDLGYEISFSSGEFLKSDAQKALDNDEYDEIISFKLDGKKIMFEDYQNDMNLSSTNTEVIVNQITSIYYNKKLVDLGLTSKQLEDLDVGFELNNNH